MGLFSKSQVASINAIAQKSKAVQSSVSTKKVSSINDELSQSSKAVEEYFKDSPAILIENKQQLHDYVTAVIESGYAGIDTETTGLDRQTDYIVGASLYYPGGVECYIPLKHRIPIFEDPYKGQISFSDLSEELKRLVDGNVKLIFANANFDLYMIWKDLNIDLTPAFYYDVILAWRCLKENELHNGLKELYNKYVLKGKGDPKRFSDFFSPSLFPYCKPEIAKLYAANDAKITYDLFIWQLPFTDKNSKLCQKNHLENISDLIWHVEFPLVSSIQQIERAGMYIDQDFSKILQSKYHNAYEHEMKNLQDMVQAAIDNSNVVSSKQPPFTSGANFNPKSTMHVKYLLYTLLDLPKPEGKESTGKEVLAEFNLPITSKIAEVRSLATNINTFVDKLPDVVGKDGKIHADFKQIGAACITGDSIIATKSGYSTAQELCRASEEHPGEFVELEDIYIINKDQKYENASHCIMYKNVDTVKINCEFGISIEGTPNHPVMVSKYNNSDRLRNLMYYYKGEYRNLGKLWEGRKFKCLEDIQIGDLIEIPCNYSNSAEYQPTNISLSKPSYNQVNSQAIIPDVYTEDFAEFLGMYHADGSSCLREGTYTICLSNDNPEVYTRFDDLAYKLFRVKTCRYDKQKDKNEVETYINCIRLCSLESTILHTGKRNKRIPKAIWNSPTSVINAYVKGMTLDSTVYVDENGRAAFQLSIIDKTDAKLIQMHLISQGIWSHIGKNVKDVNDRFLNLTFNADNYILFRDKIGFIESKKYIETGPCKKNQYWNRRVGNSFYVKVKSIEKSKNDVYDLHVPQSHSFISNCMISHNTGRMSSASPNLQNIPSKLDDIRHMFRATPMQCETVNSETLEFKLNSHSYVTLEDKTQKLVSKLDKGDVLEVDNGKNDVIRCSVCEISQEDNSSVLIRLEQLDA